jgi:hypothetical protein
MTINGMQGATISGMPNPENREFGILGDVYTSDTGEIYFKESNDLLNVGWVKYEQNPSPTPTPTITATPTPTPTPYPSPTPTPIDTITARFNSIYQEGFFSNGNNGLILGFVPSETGEYQVSGGIIVRTVNEARLSLTGVASAGVTTPNFSFELHPTQSVFNTSVLLYKGNPYTVRLSSDIGAGNDGWMMVKSAQTGGLLAVSARGVDDTNGPGFTVSASLIPGANPWYRTLSNLTQWSTSEVEQSIPTIDSMETAYQSGSVILAEYYATSRTQTQPEATLPTYTSPTMTLLLISGSDSISTTPDQYIQLGQNVTMSYVGYAFPRDYRFTLTKDGSQIYSSTSSMEYHISNFSATNAGVYVAKVNTISGEASSSMTLHNSSQPISTKKWVTAIIPTRQYLMGPHFTHYVINGYGTPSPYAKCFGMEYLLSGSWRDMYIEIMDYSSDGRLISGGFTPELESCINSGNYTLYCGGIE